eukprot:1073833_1
MAPIEIFAFVCVVIGVSSQSSDWVLSSNIVLSDTGTAMSVQRHPTLSNIAYGARMRAGLDTLQIQADTVQLIHTDAPDSSFAYYRLHASTVNNYLYVAANPGGVVRYDITTNPLQPTVSGSNLYPNSMVPATINDVTTDSNYVYAVGMRNGFIFFCILNHDLSFIVTATMDGDYPANQLVSAYFVDDETIATGDNLGRLWTWDISSPMSLSAKGSLPLSATSLGGIYGITSPYNEASNEILLVTHSVDGILSVNISQNVFTSTVEIDEDLGGSDGGYPWWIERVGSIGYIANSISGISIIDLSVLGSFSVIDFVNDGPKDGPIATSLAAYGLAVFDNHILTPNAGQAAAAGYVLFKKNTDTPSPTTNTLSPTAITSSPSANTLSPTVITSSPSANTPSPSTNTFSPTSITPSPTSNTLSPTSITNAPSSVVNTTLVSSHYTTANYGVVSTTFLFDAEEKHWDDLDDLSHLFQMTAGSFVAACIVIALLAFIDAKLIRPNDYFEAVAIFSMLIQTVDIMSDCFFAMEVKMQTDNSALDNEEMKWINIMLYASILFIALPAILTLFQLYFYAKRHWLSNDYVRQWLSKYSTVLLVLSIATGSSFAATSVLNSFIFQIEVFDMGLTNKELKQFKTQRVYSIVLMENVPQLFIQSYYIYLIRGTLGDNLIAVSSIMFSLLSIIVSVMSLTLIQTINKTQRYVVLSMDVTGDCVEERSSKCRTMKKGLKKRVCALIGVDARMLDIMKPTYISNGLRVEIRVYVNNRTQCNNYGSVLIEANDKGKLSRMFQTYWNLSDAPRICDIKSDIVDPSDPTQKTEGQKETLNKKRATHV